MGKKKRDCEYLFIERHEDGSVTHVKPSKMTPEQIEKVMEKLFEYEDTDENTLVAVRPLNYPKTQWVITDETKMEEDICFSTFKAWCEERDIEMDQLRENPFLWNLTFNTFKEDLKKSENCSYLKNLKLKLFHDTHPDIEGYAESAYTFMRKIAPNSKWVIPWKDWLEKYCFDINAMDRVIQYDTLKEYINDISENGFKDVNLNIYYSRKVPTEEGGNINMIDEMHSIAYYEKSGKTIADFKNSLIRDIIAEWNEFEDWCCNRGIDPWELSDEDCNKKRQEFLNEKERTQDMICQK